MEHWGRKHIGLRTLASRVRRHRRPGRFDRLRRIAKRRSTRVAAGLLAVAVLAGVIIPILTQRQASAATWWSPYWKYRKQITFNNSASTENLVNFPVRVSLSSSNIDYAKTLDTGYDLRFTDTDGKLLDYEIERWDEAGTSEVWVEVPQIDANSTSDSIWMYYGNEGAGDGQNKTGVWGGAGYVGVWHNGETSGQVVDSTANITSTTATITGNGQTTNTKIGRSHDFESSTGADIVISPNTAALNVTSAYSIEGWVRLESWTGQFESIASKGGGISPNFEIGVDNTNNIRLRYGAGGVGSTIVTTTNTITTGTFYHVFATLNSSTDTGVIYINGVSRTVSGTVTANPATNSSSIYMGNNGADHQFDGVIDELRVMNSDKSGEWAEASYITQNNGMNSFGSEQSGTYSPEGTWTKRRKITFNNSASAENLVNFPVRVSLTGGTNIDYNATQSNGEDIRFTDSDGTTKLSYEIEKWDETGGTAVSEVWVKVPQINASSSTDYIYMYYGNVNAADGQNKTDTWETAYKGVWHLQQDPSVAGAGGILDSTSNAQNGTDNGSMNSADSVAAKVNKGLDFDGVDDYVGVPYSTNNTPTNVSIGAWVNSSNLGAGDGGIASKTNSGGYGLVQADAAVGGTGFCGFKIYVGGTSYGVGVATNTLPNTWFHMMGTYDGETARLYINGAQVSQNTSPSGALSYSSNNSLIIGSDADTGSTPAIDAWLTGGLDELRLHNTGRSADWVEAEYITSNNAMNTFDSEESGTYLASVVWSYRRKITFNNMTMSNGSNLTDFPLRVSLSAAKGNIDYADTQDSGQDIRFVDDDNVTAYSYEIEQWNESGTSEAWVKIPQLSGGKQTEYMWMYYGNAGATDGQQPESVWNDGNFRTVYHMADTSGTTITDATSSSYDGTKVASGRPAATTSGQIGAAQNFSSGTTDYVTVNGVPSDVNLRTGNFTQSFWFKLNANAGVGAACHEFFALSDVNSTNDQKTYIDGTCSGNTGKLSFSMYNTAGSTQLAQTAETSWSAGTWYYVSAVYSSTAGMKLYVNGVQNGSNANTQRGATNATTAFLGKLWNNTNYLNGTLDDLRLSSTARSADWVNAEYRSGADQMATYGPQESQTASREAWCNDASGVTCDTTWNYRRRIELINVPSTENLANFPVLVKLSSASVGSQLGNIDYGKTQDDGDDIRFVDPSNSAVVIPHEIETWNESGDSFVWVRVPQIDTGKNSDYIWMYYGNSTVSSPATQLGNGTHATDVWSSSYKMVQHMEETGACPTTFTDSSVTANSGTCAGSPTSTTGLIGSARNFTAASSQYMNIDSAANDLQNTGVTLGVWFKLTSNFTSSSPNDLQIYDLGDNSASNDFDLALSSIDGRLNFCGLDGSVIDQCVGSPQTSWTAGVWYHAVVSWEIGVGRKLYVNGALVATDSVATRGGTPYAQLMNLGSWRTSSDYFNGVLEEAQLSSTHRSTGWVGAEYSTQINAMNTFGAEELAPLASPTLTAFANQVSTTPTFQLRGPDAYDPNWLRYKIEVCTNADCSSILRTIDQSTSQTGWSGQDANTSTAYVASATLTSSTLASHTYQSPALTAGQTYWWRGYSVDDTGATSDASTISSFIVAGPPAAPTLVSPASGETGVRLAPLFRLWTTDPNSDNVKYQIHVCDTATCTDDDGGGPHLGVIRDIDQRSLQTGWATQNAESAAAYSAAPLLADSQQAVHLYQSPFLSGNTQYWWRAYAHDPTGSNLSSSASAIQSFTTSPSVDNVRIQRGTIINGNTIIGGP